MRLFLLKWLIRLSDIPKAPKPDQKTEDFLALCWSNEHFRRYLFAREEKLKAYITTQIDGGPRPATQLTLAMGQLQELVNLRNLAELAASHKLQQAQEKLLTPVDSVKRATM